MEKSVHTLDEYKEISSDVWMYYKKFFNVDFDDEEEINAASAIGDKYKKNPRLYEFANKMINIFHRELWEIKELYYGK